MFPVFYCDIQALRNSRRHGNAATVKIKEEAESCVQNCMSHVVLNDFCPLKLVCGHHVVVSFQSFVKVQQSSSFSRKLKTSGGCKQRANYADD